MTVPDLAVHAKDMTVAYGDFTAVDGVNLSATKGEIVGLLGPNGAGKTSVLRALTTIVPISGGEASVAGESLARPQRVRERIGVLPESNGYPTALSAPAYLRYYAQLFGIRTVDADRNAAVVLEQVGLAGNQNPIGSFSRGMRQRLGIARALINDPAVLFLDEPTLGLDPAGKADMLDHLSATVAQEGTCVILCSHLLDEIEQVCDRVAIMNHGRIVADGPVDAVVAQAGLDRRGRLRVSASDVDAAARVLASSRAVTMSAVDDADAGLIHVEVDADSDRPLGEIVAALLDARIEPVGFDFEQARLSEAFLALTRKGDNR